MGAAQGSHQAYGPHGGIAYRGSDYKFEVLAVLNCSCRFDLLRRREFCQRAWCMHPPVATFSCRPTVQRRDQPRGRRWVPGSRSTSLILAALLSATRAVAGGTPANDRCEDATAITELPYSATALTSAATTDPADPTPQCSIDSPNSRGKSVWYAVTSSTAATVIADTFDSDYDTILTAYSGACDALQPIPDACSDDDPLDGAQSRVVIAVTPGTTYRLMVTAFNDDGGTLQLHVVAGATGGATPTLTPSVAGTPLPTRTPPGSFAGDANCDGRTTAADLTAVITLMGAGARAPCGRDDADGDGVLSAADLDAIVSLIFAS
jgi:hypothetical protein